MDMDKNNYSNYNNFIISFSSIPNCKYFIKFIDERIYYENSQTYGECEIRMIKCDYFKMKMNLQTCKDCHHRVPVT